MTRPTHHPERLWVDQFGNKFIAATVAEMRSKVPGRVSKMYLDDADGTSVQTGYVIGRHWFTVYTLTPMREQAQ